MARVPFENWVPIDINELEPAAWRALLDPGNVCVIAGPGAGKTEFLAQKASYLIDSTAFSSKQRILAISFKRDAAANLNSRVKLRSPEATSRFHSMTFDAFTKSILDRFHRSLPGRWSLKSDYRINFPSKQDVTEFLNRLAGVYPEHSEQILEIEPATFMQRSVGVYALPSSRDQPNNPVEMAILDWWDERYVRPERQVLDFNMINRLADLVVRTNPQLKRAVIATYGHVFIDELQDTTFAQYSFLQSLFGGSTSVVTAVGDSKQRIMGFAGAMPNAIDDFVNDFGANRFELEWNFRSSSALTNLQHKFACQIEESNVPAISKISAEFDEGAIEIWNFDRVDDEAMKVSEWIATDMTASGRRPTDYVLIGRQTVGSFEEAFGRELEKRGIRLRNDDQLFGKLRLQDLLVDEFTIQFLNFMRLALRRGNADIWREVSSLFVRLHRVDPESELALWKSDERLSGELRAFREWLLNETPSPEVIRALIKRVLAIYEVGSVRSVFPGCREELDLRERLEAINARLLDVSEGDDDWQSIIDEFDCKDAVALMTVHKSKGLEFHTVVFLSVDDKQWWSHRREHEASLSTFFVGLSRACQRIIVTYCPRRGGRSDVEDLYSVLQDGGAVSISK
jgi:superfamily I DNA/RNA helicase